MSPPSTWPLPFPALDALPWLSVAQLEQVGVAPAHLVLQLAGYVVAGELAQLFGDDELKGQVKQQVADFSADLTGLSFAERVVQLQHLLDQVGPQRLAGLRPIPGAPISKFPHHRHRTSKR